MDFALIHKERCIPGAKSIGTGEGFSAKLNESTDMVIKKEYLFI